jgi:hypothetical protein
MSLSRLTSGSWRDDRRDGMLDQTRHLRNKADDLLRLENNLSNSAAHLDQRAANLNSAEHKLRKLEAALERRERALADRERETLTEQTTQANNADAEQLARSLNSDSIDRAFDAGNTSAVAAAIIRAGAKARGEIDNGRSAPTGVAAQIIRAGKLARGEIVDDAALTGMARAVILSGRKARGEILSAADSAWHDAFCKHNWTAGHE